MDKNGYEKAIAKVLADNAAAGRSFEDVAEIMQIDATVIGNSFEITVPMWTNGEGILTEPDEPQVYEVTVRRVL